MEMADVEYGLMHIGERIAEARKGMGLGEEELATITWSTSEDVRSWEASRSRPALWQVLEVAGRCGVTPDWLMGRDLVEEFLLNSERCWFRLQPGVRLQDVPLEDVEAALDFIRYAERRRREREVTARADGARDSPAPDGDPAPVG